VLDKFGVHDFIAIDNGKSFYLPLHASELQSCFHVGEYHICEHGSTVYRKDFSEFCISAIMVANNDATRRRCKLFIRQLKDVEVFSAGEGVFLVQSPRKTEFITRCQDGTEKNGLINVGVHIIEIKPGCFGLVGDRFRLEHLPMIRVDLKDLEFALAAAYNGVLHGNELDEILNFYEKQSVTALPGSSFGELNELISSMREAETDVYTKMLIIIIIAILAVCVFTFVCVRRCRRRRRRSLGRKEGVLATQQQPQQVVLASEDLSHVMVNVRPPASRALGYGQV